MTGEVGRLALRDLCRELEDPFKWTRTVRARMLQMTLWLLGVLIGFVEVARDEADTTRRVWLVYGFTDLKSIRDGIAGY